MTTENPGLPRYNALAKILHSVMLILILAQFAVAWFMPHIRRGTEPNGLVGIHVTLGVVLLGLIVLRIIWRLTHRPNMVVATWNDRFSVGLHGLMYLLMLVIPVLGWANANARGWWVSLTPSLKADEAGLSLPMLLDKGSHIGHEMGDIHGLLAWGFLALIALHVLAALHHQLRLKEPVLSRIFGHGSKPQS
jgi:cytochrome b561